MRRWLPTESDGSGVPIASSASRGTDLRPAAQVLAALLVLGSLLGTANLFVTGVIRDGTPRAVYAATMVLCMLAAVPLAVRRRVGRRETLALVLLGDLIYVVVALSIADPIRYASPLILLFASFTAAWFLGRWELLVNMAVTVVACLIALWHSYDTWTGLVVQVVVSAGMLDAAAFGVFLLRGRIERLLAATQELSITDPLTGLFNRRYLVDQAVRVWRQGRRDGTQVAAMVLDLDHFKRLNDAHGHAVGDAVLRAVAGALGAAVRPADVLSRTGGEEIVVVSLVGEAAEAGRLAERLRAAVAGARTPDGHAVTASVGLALTRPVDGEDAAEGLWRLIDRADGAMYEAKQAGRDRVAEALAPHALAH